MKLFARKKTSSPPSERRHVAPAGRPNAYAYYARRSPERTILGRHMLQDIKAPERARYAVSFWRQRFGALMIILVLIVSAISILDVSTDPKIVPVDGSQVGYLHSLAIYQQAARSLFAGSILNQNKITVDTNGISRNLKHTYPELAVVSVSLPLIGHRPIIYIEPTKQALVLLTSAGRMYVIDANGRAVGDATAASSVQLHLVVVKDESGAGVRVGDLALSSDTVDFIRSVLFQLQQKHLAVSTVVLPAGKSELDVYITGQSYFVKFNLQSGTATQQAGTYLAVLHALQGRGVTPAQYIDVRIDGRAYYK